MSGNKQTLVIGASDNPDRYSFMAITLLRQHHYTVKAIGRKQALVLDVPVETAKQDLEDIHTVTLYINPDHQKEFEEYILSLHPKRIIFNPGTENPAFEEKAKSAGIETMQACTLVLLQTGQY
ncbi:MAG: CoA-binding protein [Sphingobacteriales bacterium]|jgi:predicted CoA-binding protein